ncbi:DUF2972 domain-containing protein, partial [Campylobacter jejuni]|nr:DUF2972 domain-containing protein [Campylobacter jejuni]ECQ8754010.1 DUF2972 domain-containing protein [Campylobacter jejuni]EDP6059418.1 DUF2972 domain-containing protein [Campylobacter jejuni]
INIFTPYLLKFCKPLKDDYKFILFSYGVSGHWAFKSFLKYCELDDFVLYQNNYSYYKEYKNFNKKNYYVEIAWYQSMQPKYKHISKILNKNKPVVILTRDPISRLKTMVNHGSYKIEELGKNELKNFYINEDIFENLDRIRYTDKNGHNANLKKPDLSSIYFIVNEELSFSYFSNINLIKNKNILYVDTKSISKDNAFATIKTLAKELNFKEPNDNDEYKFKQKFWNELYYLLPYRFIVNNDILIIVSDENKVFLDNDKYYKEIKDDLIDIKKELVNTKSKLFDKISINIENKNWTIIKDDKALINDLREYFEKFMIILEKKANERLENMVKEEDVLNYLKEHQDLGKKIKNILDYELQHIKEHRPDIINSWEYYKKFLEFFKE